MTSFSRGTNAPGQCHRCGFVYRLNELQYQVVGAKVTSLRVCPDCLDEDHPQLMLSRLRVSDPQTLRNPSPRNEIDITPENPAVPLPTAPPAGPPLVTPFLLGRGQLGISRLGVVLLGSP